MTKVPSLTARSPGPPHDLRRFFSGEWWSPVFPGLAISLSVIGFNLLGDALRDGLDPRKSRAAGGSAAMAGLAG